MNSNAFNRFVSQNPKVALVLLLAFVGIVVFLFWLEMAGQSENARTGAETMRQMQESQDKTNEILRRVQNN